MTSRPGGIVIAIDGPAASGKSSTARAVAERLGYRHLDSGAFYRTVTLAALDRAIPPERWPELTLEDLAAFHIEALPAAGGYRLTIAGTDVGDRIRAPEVNARVSVMAAIPTVRDWLLSALRDAARSGGLVADGRDMGTVVFPDAELKIFLVATPDVRARRRLREHGHITPDEPQLLEESRRLSERDRMDQERAAAPLVQAPDAAVIDTSLLDFEAQVSTIVDLARDRVRA